MRGDPSNLVEPLDANQAALVSALDALAVLLDEAVAERNGGEPMAERRAGTNSTVARNGVPRRTPSTRAKRTGAGAERGDGERDRRDLPGVPGAVPRLDALAARLGLTDFESRIVLLCAGVELDAGFADRVQRLGGCTFSLALAALPGAHWSALRPSGALRAWRLVELGGHSITRAPLRLDEPLLHWLCGLEFEDERLRGLLRDVSVGPLAPSHREPAERLERCWRVMTGAVASFLSAAEEDGDPDLEAAWARQLDVGAGVAPGVQLVGSDAAARDAVAAAAAAALGLRVHVVEASDLPESAGEQGDVARLLERHALLAGCVLALQVSDTSGPGLLRRAVDLSDRLRVLHVLSAPEPAPPGRRALIRIDVARPEPREQATFWFEAMAWIGPQSRRIRDRATPTGAPALRDWIDRVSRQFTLGLGDLAAARLELHAEVARPEHGDVDALGKAMWSICRRRARPHLDALAVRSASHAGWADLVLPDAQRHALEAMARHVRHHATVYERWGFGAAAGLRGGGVTALFAGPSGTGKTLAAEVVAGALELDLYRVDLSATVSKWIGETEKNLRRIFDAAEAGGAVLLFDEADALFGRRSEVRDSHDRYANIEVGYLLQRMETYRGLAILTTNVKSALDTAFMRRLRFVIEFPFPDAAMRERIWRRAFPPGAPLDGVDPARLARLGISGAAIQNIALGAAFAAAATGSPIRMSHLREAAQRECAKLDRPALASEIGAWS